MTTPRPTRSSRSSTASRSASACEGGAKGLIRDTETGGVKVALVADVGEDALLVHDAHNPDPTMAFAISRLTDSGYLNQSPIGIFRQVERPTYDDLARAQVATAREAATGDADRAARRPHQRRRHLDGPLTLHVDETAPTNREGGGPSCVLSCRSAAAALAGRG